MELKDNAFYEGLTFSDLEFSRGIIKSSTFERCEFVDCDFNESQFNDCKFLECVFKNSNLGLVKLTQTRFIETRFELCKIIGVNWTLLNWTGITMSAPVGFDSCDISFSAFNSLKLPGLMIRNCKAHDVGFEYCDLTGADFFKTDLTNTRFSSSELNNCDFREASNFSINPTENSIEGANFSFPEVLNLLSSFRIKMDEF